MLHIEFTLLQHYIALPNVKPFTDSFRNSTSTITIHLYFTGSKICFIFHLQLHMEYVETAASLQSRRINPEPRPINQNPVFCTICSKKNNQGLQQDMAHTCSGENCDARCHHTCNDLSIDRTCHAKVLVTLSPGNLLNIALESLRILYHLFQFMNNQIVPLPLENLPPFARILSALVMLI